VAAEGLSSPPGYRWCRGRAGVWHLLKAAELVHQGRPLTTARSVCGLWASLLAEEAGAPSGWTEVTDRVTPEPRRMWAACLAAVAAAQRRERQGAPATKQARLL
jgi:hypothetical protein